MEKLTIYIFCYMGNLNKLHDFSKDCIIFSFKSHQPPWTVSTWAPIKFGILNDVHLRPCFTTERMSTEKKFGNQMYEWHKLLSGFLFGTIQRDVEGVDLQLKLILLNMFPLKSWNSQYKDKIHVSYKIKVASRKYCTIYSLTKFIVKILIKKYFLSNLSHNFI